jgi:3'(2'), 5'-bisphosphate nucleotidase
VEKEDRSPVSVADLGSQAVVTLELLKGFPGDPVVGEEEADTLIAHEDLKQKVLDLVRQQNDSIDERLLLEAVDYGAKDFDPGKRFWTLDPIDGTKGFLRRDQFAVALALLVNGEAVLGVLGCPNFVLDESDPSGKGALFYAVRGAGAFCKPLDGGKEAAVAVDGITDMASARFCESVEKAHASHGKHQQIADALGIRAAPCRIDSQVKYAALARGDASIYLRLPRSSDYREKIWDHAAGTIIVEEAGGRVSDFSGNPLRFDLGRKLTDNVGILATNGSIHDKVLAAIADVVGSK